MKLKSKTKFLLLTFFQFWCIQQAASQKDFRDATIAFAKNLLREISGRNGTKNFVVSPIAVQRLLLLVMQGAHGRTYKDIQNIIQVAGINEWTYVKDLAKRPTEFTSNDNIYKSTKVKLRQPFKLLSRLLFDVTTYEIDFKNVTEAARKISESVELSTNGLIRKYVNPLDLDPYTSICYMNNALFNGKWRWPFNKRSIRMGKFYNNGKTAMSLAALYGVIYTGYAVLNDLKAKAVSLSYQNTSEELVIILPEERNGLKSVIDKTLSTDLSLLVRKLKPTLVALTLPHFSLNYRVDFLAAARLRSHKLLSPYADFGNTFEDPIPPFVPCLFSKTHFDISEYGSGTYEASQKVDSIQVKNVQSPEMFFFVEHPFLFFLHNNGMVHFFGRVVNLNTQQSEQSDKTTSASEPDKQTEEETEEETEEYGAG